MRYVVIYPAELGSRREYFVVISLKFVLYIEYLSKLWHNNSPDFLILVLQQKQIY